MKKYIIGVDLGGTYVRVGLFHGKSMVVFLDELTDRRGGKRVIQQIIGMIESLLENLDRKYLFGIGLGVPGMVDAQKGILYLAPNIPGLKHVPLKRMFEKKFHASVFVENDVNCAALAEARYRKADSLIYINLGTGVGGGIVIDGKLLHSGGMNPEPGHIAIGDGRKCNLGHTGCWEAFVSGRSILRHARKFYGKPELPLLLEEARCGEAKAKAIFEYAGVYLGRGLATLVNLFHPSLVVLGGGAAEAYPYMKKTALVELRRRAFSLPSIDIVKLKHAGLIGAKMLVENGAR